MQKIKFIKAGAGSGKTYRLTHDLADMLKAGTVNPSEVIVTTFTKAAANEIKERARKVLLETGNIPAASKLDSAAIGTVHAVCQMFVDRYWYAIGGTPGRTVIGEEDQRIYRNQSISQMLKKAKYAHYKSLMWNFFFTFKPTSPDENFIPKIDPDFWMKHLAEVVKSMTYYKIDNPEESLKASYATIDEIWGSMAQTDTDSKAKVKLIKDYVEALLEMGQGWMDDYAVYKKSHGVIDYDDMENDFLRLLDVEEVRQDIARRYKLVMVDEYQDSNPIQVEIFKKLSDIVAQNSDLPQSSLWVGDPNQAIYGFRGSDTSLIDMVISQFPEKEEEADANGLMLDSLKTCYRSRPAIVTAVNKAFHKNDLFPNMVELGANRPEFPTDMPAAIQRWKFGDTREREFADHLAREIKRIVTSGEMMYFDDDKAYKPLDYGDIAILCRTNSSVKMYAEALRTEGIPVSAPDLRIADRAEVQLVLAILRLADKSMLASDPKNAYSIYRHEWASVLRLYCDWPTEKILASGAEALQASTADEKYNWPDNLEVLEPIRLLLEHLKNKSMSDKVRHIILELGLTDKVNKWEGTHERQTNLLSLQKAVDSYCQRCVNLYMPATADGLEDYLASTNLKSEFDMSDNTVKVISYHKSKGLEWPMVILGTLDDNDTTGRNYAEKNFWGVRVMSTDATSADGQPLYCLHIVPSINEEESGLTVEDEVVSGNAFYQSTKDMARNEMRRLMYVGMTRARDYMILSEFSNKHDWLGEIKLDIEDLNPAEKTFDALLPKTVRKPAEPGDNARKKTKDEYPEKLKSYNEYLEKIAAEEKYRSERNVTKTYSLNDLPELRASENDDRELLPSKLPATHGVQISVDDLISVGAGVAVCENSAQEGEKSHSFSSSAFGTCIHNVFAACPTQARPTSENSVKEYEQIAAGIIRNHGFTEQLPDAAPLVESLYALYDWLTDNYGPAIAVAHELPFNWPLDDGHLMKGEMDLVWYTSENEAVIVDFKNYRSEADKIPELPNTAHYVSQLRAYSTILESAGIKVLDRILYYDILGKVLKV